MTNAVLHAYRESGAGEVRVLARVDAAGWVEVVVEDDGPGVEPRSDSPGLGLGLPTIAALVSRLEDGVGARGARLRMGFAPSS